jgi:glycosyltransferase involved in cell wall biosynthesis
MSERDSGAAMATIPTGDGLEPTNLVKMLSPCRPEIKVLHVLDNLGMGGAETWLMEMLRFWRRRGPDAPRFDFLATGGMPTYYDEEAKHYGANIFYLRYGRSHLASFVRGFRQILYNGQYCAIHDHGDHAAGWHFLMGGTALPAVRIVHVHNPAFHIRHNYGVTLPRRVTARIGKSLVARYATHITGTSRQVISEYGFDTPRFQYIPKMALHCGFDTQPYGVLDGARDSVRHEFGWPAAAKIILFAGRVDQSPNLGHPLNHKNSAFAVAIGIEAARLDPNVHMIFAGALSPAVPILEQRIAGAELAGRIRFLGIRNDLKRLMCASDVLLFPSCGEGLGMVTVEAQAAGLPVLASTAVPRECVVVPDLVRFESLERSAAEWATALLQHAARPRDIAAANQRVAASPFAIENSARALVELYSQGVRA